LAPGFQGACASWIDDTTGTADKVIPATCDVRVYSSGLRNMYDFVYHSNGFIYGPDNGLGVQGTVPVSPEPDCQGIVPYSTAFDPGVRPDIFHRLMEGGYYGHPNPARDECVFYDGQLQGTPPLPNLVAPLANLGNNRSANGTIEYLSDEFCGDLRGNILITNYSVGDNITRIRLAPDGLSVAAVENLASGFSNPLPLVQDPQGFLYVGELESGRITVLKPVNVGCWWVGSPLPQAVLDAGGAALNGKLYVVAGKTIAGPQSTLHIYDPATDAWATGPNLPGPAVENPAVVGLNARLYVFGGSTGPFSGAVANAAAFEPATGTWFTLPPMQTARGGATAQVINGMIYVVGGMDASGASLATVEIYNPSTNTWSAGAAMSTRRDNPGSAVLGGKLYVFGGRTRNADGSVVNATLNTVEMYDPGTGGWTSRASMPTGRRTMAVGTLNGRAQVMGGEATSTGGTFPENEEYDPLTDSWRALKPMAEPRHGTASGTINGFVYVVGGGPTAGSSFTTANHAFSFTSPTQ
jgi:N-acetylneuraminic acid mutarotase